MGDDRAAALSLPAFDFNGDGKFTISDAGAWLMQIVLLPGDAALSLVLRYAPAAAGFLELGADDYGSTLSLVVSVVFWVVVVALLGLTINLVRNFDHWLTAWFGHLGGEILRRLRVSRRLLMSRIGQLRRQRQERATEPMVAEVALDTFDAAVLRCYAGAGDMRVVASDEVANSLRASLRRVETALGRLRGYRLIEPAFGTDRGRETHQITRAGQIYLLER
jgi:hypothetical protein